MTGKTTPLYVVCSPRRCVGKTLVSRLLTEFYVIDDRPVAAFDLADEGPQLADYLPEITTIADIGDTWGQMAFFEGLIADNDGAKIIDLAHRAFDTFFTVVHKIGFFGEARRRSIEPLILFIIDPDPKSTKAYATLRRWFTEVSLLPVRNQTEASDLPDCDAPASTSTTLSPLDIPFLGFSLRALIDRKSFLFSQYWLATPADLPDALDDELRAWVEGVFFQIRGLELFLGCEQPSTRIELKRARAIHHQLQWDAPSLGDISRRDVGPTAANRGSIDVPEQVLKFAPQKERRNDSDPMDQSGHAILAMLQEAGRRLEAAEDRINQLKTEIERLQDRAVRAEMWLQLIQKEIEEKLIAQLPVRNR